ncbi:hypothetical protein AKJ09_06677 [Labilithrix luteola]|uniref:Integral membrane protein n=1 Tax=Labilithrix luteola TaxID=1391654 RepID=A0A0K1Q2L9_9BACT|nr:DUF975 family protein [Labilithrix luteola]AKV00014.1 hypothetical protein AKJ09_06677 [Labilithrix luteola]
MNVGTFSVSEAFRFGWDTFKRHLGLSIAVVVAGIVPLMLLNGMASAAENSSRFLSVVLGLVAALVRVLWGFVLLRLGLALYDGRAVTGQTVRELLPDGPTFLTYLAVSILYSLLVAAGLILLVIPGIYLAVRYGFCEFFVADRRTASVGEAFRRSSDITRGERWRLFVLELALVVLNVLGAMFFGFGLLVTVPLSIFAMVMVYRRLAARTAGEEILVHEPTLAPA